jgi:hypothetical protein
LGRLCAQMKTHKACDKSNNIFSLNDRLNIFNNLRASTPVCLATVLHYVHYSAAILVRYRSLQRIRTLGRSKICINVVLPVVRGLRAEFYPRILRKYKDGVCLNVTCLYQLVRTNFYVKLFAQSKCFDFRFGAFCFFVRSLPADFYG